MIADSTYSYVDQTTQKDYARASTIFKASRSPSISTIRSHEYLKFVTYLRKKNIAIRERQTAFKLPPSTPLSRNNSVLPFIRPGFTSPLIPAATNNPPPRFRRRIGHGLRRDISGKITRELSNSSSQERPSNPWKMYLVQ